MITCKKLEELEKEIDNGRKLTVEQLQDELGEIKMIKEDFYDGISYRVEAYDDEEEEIFFLNVWADVKNSVDEDGFYNFEEGIVKSISF